jgi:monothiol glutaredoxin
MSLRATIHEQVTGHDVVLYIKGTPRFPRCGFSATAVQVLKACGVTNYFAVDVLESEELRQAVKDYANWPTFPQLYVRGQLIGGADIMRELYQSGELQRILA